MKPSIVFSHGIWADGSCFQKVIPALRAEGHQVIAAQYGLDTVKGDVEATVRTFGRVSAPIVLVGHSYGGTVITHAGTDKRVAALVYIAALGPDETETSQGQQDKFPQTDVFKHGTLSNGAPYMVMEYLAGRDLGEIVESGGPLSQLDAVDFVLQACEAIAEAHSYGIVHRDLKPRNLFVTHGVDGKPLVKVLDFGISKQTAASSQKELSLTRTTSVMGSPNYMSPEQLKSSKSVDARTDIWALGVVLFEVLTTRVPFEAETVTQLTAMVLQDTPRRVDELRADVTRGLGLVIARCLEKDPAMRYPSVAELARDLEPFGSLRGVAARIAQVTGQRPPSPLAASSGRVAAAGGTSVAWGETQLAAAPRRRGVIAAVALAGVLLLVGAGVVIGRARFSSSGTSPLEVTPTVRQIDLAAPAPSIAPAAASALASAATPAPTLSAAPSASVSSPALAVPSTATAHGHPKSPSMPHAPPPAKWPKGSDEAFPSERN